MHPACPVFDGVLFFPVTACTETGEVDIDLLARHVRDGVIRRRVGGGADGAGYMKSIDPDYEAVADLPLEFRRWHGLRPDDPVQQQPADERVVAERHPRDVTCDASLMTADRSFIPSAVTRISSTLPRRLHDVQPVSRSD